MGRGLLSCRRPCLVPKDVAPAVSRGPQSSPNGCRQGVAGCISLSPSHYISCVLIWNHFSVLMLMRLVHFSVLLPPPPQISIGHSALRLLCPVLIEHESHIWHLFSLPVWKTTGGVGTPSCGRKRCCHYRVCCGSRYQTKLCRSKLCSHPACLAVVCGVFGAPLQCNAGAAVA